ncbi:hypothetical protein [Cohnella laeviribosi]|uniref:hypothetical protein n=1 Tax=Cohnella laeviribosi TaxID=380174 RepID=UPI0012EBE683|nr:hypothetical protein [Cohnella laeviribosi]
MSIKIGKNGDGKEEKSVKHEIRIQRKPNPIGFFLTCKNPAESDGGESGWRKRIIIYWTSLPGISLETLHHHVF